MVDVVALKQQLLSQYDLLQNRIKDLSQAAEKEVYYLWVYSSLNFIGPFLNLAKSGYGWWHVNREELDDLLPKNIYGSPGAKFMHVESTFLSYTLLMWWDLSWMIIIIIKALSQLCWGWLYEFCFSIPIYLDLNPQIHFWIVVTCWKSWPENS